MPKDWRRNYVIYDSFLDFFWRKTIEIYTRMLGLMRINTIIGDGSWVILTSLTVCTAAVKLQFLTSN